MAKHLGQNRLNTLKNLIPQSILLNASLGSIFLVITYLFAEQIFRGYSASGLLLENTVSYFKIRAFGFPLALMTFGCFGIFRGLQNTIWAMSIAISGSVLNLLLNLALVYGIEGIIPALGLSGAAYASLAAQSYMLFMACWFLIKKTPFGLFGKWRLHPEFKNLLGLSYNLFVRTLLLNLAYFIANKILSLIHI